MYLKGLDELDRKILDLLTQNARYTYSELGERLGLSRVAIKNRMDALEERGIIEGYTVIVNPQKLGSAVSCYYELEARPDALPEILRRLEACPTVTQIYRVTGECCLHIHAVAADQEELERGTGPPARRGKTDYQGDPVPGEGREGPAAVRQS